jgi:threonine dehydrogenase-like Zn-dependent dehydrogenase
MTNASTTTAVVFPAKNKAEVRTIPAPELRAGELLVRTEYSGVSQGTEIWAYVGQRPELTFPTVTGYEVGQRVLWHRSRLPESLPETWMAGHVGLAAVPLDNNPPPRVVPDGVDPIAAALAAMAAVSLRGIDMLRIRHGDLVVVTGQGLIGQASAQLARLMGATVIATDLSPRRLQLSKAHSADLVVNPRETNLKDVITSLRPKGADVVIDTTGRSEAFAECVDLLRWEGQFLMQGWYPKPVAFDFHATHLKKPTIAVTCGIGDTDRVLERIKYNKLQWRPLVTDLLPLRDAPTMYDRLAKNDPNVLGVVFDWKEQA